MKSEYNLLNEFLIKPEFRICRHIVLIATLFLLVLPMYMAAYGEAIRLSEYFFITSISLLFYYLLIQFSFKVLVYKFLNKDQPGKHVLSLLIITLAMTLFQLISSYIIELYFGFSPEAYHSTWEYWLYLFVLFSLNGFFLMGFFVIVLLRRWISDSQQINYLQKERLSAELQELKNKIRPDFLFNMLNKANVLAKPNPTQASQILLKLSHVLRYQLYDSKREYVSLSSELTFMKDYLYLEKLRSENCRFAFEETGHVQHVFIPPLLFLPVIESATRHISKFSNDRQAIIKVEVGIENDRLHFFCSVLKLDDMNPFSMEEKIIYKRIEAMYAGKNSILINDSEDFFMTHISIVYGE